MVPAPSPVRTSPSPALVSTSWRRGRAATLSRPGAGWAVRRAGSAAMKVWVPPTRRWYLLRACPSPRRITTNDTGATPSVRPWPRWVNPRRPSPEPPFSAEATPRKGRPRVSRLTSVEQAQVRSLSQHAGRPLANRSHDPTSSRHVALAGESEICIDQFADKALSDVLHARDAVRWHGFRALLCLPPPLVCWLGRGTPGHIACRCRRARLARDPAASCAGPRAGPVIRTRCTSLYLAPSVTSARSVGRGSS